VDCYIWYSEDGPGRAAAPPSLLLAVPNVTAHPSTAIVPITVLLYDGTLLCVFNLAIRALNTRSTSHYSYSNQNPNDVQQPVARFNQSWRYWTAVETQGVATAVIRHTENVDKWILYMQCIELVRSHFTSSTYDARILNITDITSNTTIRIFNWTAQTSAKPSNINQKWSGIRIRISGLIRIRIRMSAGSLPNCFGFIVFSASIILYTSLFTIKMVVQFI